MKPVRTAMLIIAAMFAADVRAAPLDEYQAATIYALAHSVSHLPLPAEPPTIHTMPHAKLVALAQEHGITAATIKALTIDDTIYLDDALDMQDVQNAAMLFHEMTHYLQFKKWGRAKDCVEWKDRELSAYHWQNEVLYKAGHQLVLVPTIKCD